MAEESNRGMPLPDKKVEVANVGSGAKAPEPSSVKVVAPSKSGIEVVALRAGFFQNTRKSEGERFIVPSMDKVGTWMKCVDKKAEELHQEQIQKKKAGVK